MTDSGASKNSGRYEPAPYLLSRIMRAIREKQQSQARIRFWYFSGASILSLSALILIVTSSFSSPSQSSFWSYASLIFTDADVALSSWKELSLVLFESLPLAALLTSLTAIFAFLWSLAHAARNISRALPLIPRVS